LTEDDFTRDWVENSLSIRRGTRAKRGEEIPASTPSPRREQMLRKKCARLRANRVTRREDGASARRIERDAMMPGTSMERGGRDEPRAPEATMKGRAL
jgi:hypothetical protein